MNLEGSIFNSLSLMLMTCGLLFWFWGTWPLLEQHSFLYKLHTLSVADTLGSILIVVGLLLRIPQQWPLLLLALLSLIVWNTIFGYVLAASSVATKNRFSIKD